MKPWRVIIAGSRGVTNQMAVDDAMGTFVQEYGLPTEVVSGACRGPDEMGERWAHARAIAVTMFPANWKLYGKSAGPIRNEKMAEYADALVAIWDGSSRGTASMIGMMRKAGKPVIVWRV